jgi:hypothetical protein
MMARYKSIHSAYKYINRSTSSTNKKLWTIIFFERGLKVVSDYYVFTSAPYVVNAMHGIAAKILAFKGVDHASNPDVVGSLTRKFTDAFTDRYFLNGGEEMGGHAEEFLAKFMHKIYPEVIVNRPDTAVILNSDSPCTCYDNRPSKALTAKHPKDPNRTYNFNESCTTKLNQLAMLIPEIPNWEIYYRKKWGVLTAKKGTNELLNNRDSAESQIANMHNISIHPFTSMMEFQCKSSIQ